MEPFRAACIQMCSGIDMASNLAMALDLVRQAHDRGAQVVLTPENTNLLEPRRRYLQEKVRFEEDDPVLAEMRALADALGIWVFIGGLAVRIGREKIANRTFVISPTGSVVARYDKIHLFDVILPDGTSFRESNAYTAGRVAVRAKTPFGLFGLTICYDLRFPSQYRLLARAGAQYLTVPSAFTRPTGEAHWHVLLRARAIENGAYVFAPAQTGVHDGGRESYGHSLIVDPWGEVLADAGDQPGVILADIDPQRVEEVRARLPVLQIDRPIALDM